MGKHSKPPQEPANYALSWIDGKGNPQYQEYVTSPAAHDAFKILQRMGIKPVLTKIR